jgi:hypothetical protein
MEIKEKLLGGRKVFLVVKEWQGKTLYLWNDGNWHETETGDAAFHGRFGSYEEAYGESTSNVPRFIHALASAS